MIGKIYRKISKSFYGSGLSKNPLIRETHKKILRNLPTTPIDVFGYKMFLDKNDSSGHSVMRDTMTEELKTLKQIIKEGDTVIDVGANIGFYTLFFRKLVGKNGKVIAFEPEPNNFIILKKNIEVNKFENVIFYNKAVGSVNKKIKMILSNDIGQHKVYNKNYDNSLYDLESSHHSKPPKLFKIDVIMLDDYIKKANFVKLDVEGYEIEVLKGMPNLLQQNIIIFSEFYLKLLKEYNEPHEFFDILTENNFEFFDVRKNLFKTDKIKIFNDYDDKSGATDILCKKITH